MIAEPGGVTSGGVIAGGVIAGGVIAGGVIAGGGAFDAAAPYALDPLVALRPEPFGALAYHYGSRRLSFLRAPELVEIVRTLGEHPSVDAALEVGVAPPRRAAFRRALASLAESSFIVPAPPAPTPA